METYAEYLAKSLRHISHDRNMSKTFGDETYTKRQILLYSADSLLLHEGIIQNWESRYSTLLNAYYRVLSLMEGNCEFCQDEMDCNLCSHRNPNEKCEFWEVKNSLI